MAQCQKSFFDVLYRAKQRQCRRDRCRQEQLGNAPSHEGDGELVLKLSIQFSGGMLRHQFHAFRLGKGEGCQRGDDVPARSVVHHHRVLGSVINLYILYAVLRTQIVFQYIRLR